MKKRTAHRAPQIHKHALSLRITMAIFTALLFLGAGGTIYFVYTQVYSAIGDVRSLINLTGNFGVEVIDFKRYERVEKSWNEKYTPTSTTFARDPFHPVPQAPTTTSTQE